MKRTIALVLSLIFMLVLVPATALADNDAEARLEITIPTATKTLFKYGTDLTLGWTTVPEPLNVTLFDNTSENETGTALGLGAAIDSTTHKYVLLINDTVYNPVTGYTFVAGDIGKKTLTVKYTYTPSGHSNAITVTADVTIAVENHYLESLSVTGPSQVFYYEGEVLNLAGLTVKAKYANQTEEKTLTSADYVVTASSDAAGTTNVISATEPLTTAQKYIIISRTETYDGAASDDSITEIAAIQLMNGATNEVAAAAKTLTLDSNLLGLKVGESDTVTATPKDALSVLVPSSCLVVTVDKPAIAAIESFSGYEIKIKGLSIGQAVVTVRTRGNLSGEASLYETIVVNVSKPDVAVTGISLDQSSLLLAVNGTYSLTAVVGPDDATDKTITWTSSDDNLVSVSSSGLVKLIKDFTSTTSAGITTIDGVKYVTITATTSSGIFAECLVAVNTIAVDGIALSETTLTLYKGSFKTIKEIVTPSGAADTSVHWTSSDTSIATVDENGMITAKGLFSGEDYGDAIITAQTSNATISATVTVHVIAGILTTKLTINKSDLALNVGESESLSVSGEPTTATNKTLIWASSNATVASVTSSGKVTGNAKGTAVITASSTDGSGKYVTCVVTVSNIQVLNVYLDKSSLDLSEGDTATVTATVYPTNATTKTLKWTSSNTSVATVDGAGNIVAGATKGYAIITAAATDGSGKFAECVVLSKPKIYVTGVTINYGTTLDLLLNDSTYLKATILPSNASTQTVTWSSSNSGVASIDANGLLKGLTIGEATITATADSKSVSIKVTVTNTEYNYGVAANFRRRVNVRATPSGLGKLVGYAYLGDTFKILGKTGAWYYIQFNNTTKGYIWASYLNATKTSAAYTSAGSASGSGTTTSPGTTTTPTKVTIANCLYAVNVRSSASTSSTRLGKASLGATYTYLGVEGDWYKIQYTSTTIGYVYGTFVSLS